MSAINDMKKELDKYKIIYEQMPLNGADTLIIKLPFKKYHISLTIGIFFREEKKIYDLYFLNILILDDESKRDKILDICNEFNMESDYEKMFLDPNNTIVIRHAGTLTNFSPEWLMGGISGTIIRLDDYLEKLLAIRWA